jgi:hypothetical protein
MPKKKQYAVKWENEQAVSFEVDGVTYASLNDIPDKGDKRKLQAMMAASSEPDFDEKEWEQTQKESLKAENLILWIFGGVAILMLLIAGVSAADAIRKILQEQSALGRVVDVVMKREYVNEQDRVVQEYYYPVVQFTAQDGRRRNVQMTEGSDPPSYEKGDQVTVRYDPAHPLEARIDSFGSAMLMWIVPGITGILGLAFGGGVLAVKWLMK